MVEQRTVAVGRVPKLLHKFGKLFDVVSDNLGVLLHVLRDVAMVRTHVMGLGHPDKAVPAVAGFYSREESKNSADIALISQVHQIVGEREVFLERGGDAAGRRGDRDVEFAPFHHLLDAPLHLADIVQVVTEDTSITGTDLCAQPAHLFAEGIEYAVPILEACAALVSGPWLDKHPLA